MEFASAEIFPAVQPLDLNKQWRDLSLSCQQGIGRFRGAVAKFGEGLSGLNRKNPAQATLAVESILTSQIRSDLKPDQIEQLRTISQAVIDNLDQPTLESKEEQLLALTIVKFANAFGQASRGRSPLGEPRLPGYIPPGEKRPGRDQQSTQRLLRRLGRGLRNYGLAVLLIGGTIFGSIRLGLLQKVWGGSIDAGRYAAVPFSKDKRNEQAAKNLGMDTSTYQSHERTAQTLLTRPTSTDNNEIGRFLRYLIGSDQQQQSITNPADWDPVTIGNARILLGQLNKQNIPPDQISETIAAKGSLTPNLQVQAQLLEYLIKMYDQGQPMSAFDQDIQQYQALFRDYWQDDNGDGNVGLEDVFKTYLKVIKLSSISAPSLAHYTDHIQRTPRPKETQRSYIRTQERQAERTRQTRKARV